MEQIEPGDIVEVVFQDPPPDWPIPRGVVLEVVPNVQALIEYEDNYPELGLGNQRTNTHDLSLLRKVGKA